MGDVLHGRNKYARGFNGITVFCVTRLRRCGYTLFLTPQPAMIFSLPVIAKLLPRHC